FLHKPFNHVLLPELSQRLAEDKPVADVLQKFYRYISILVIPVGIGAWIIGPDLIAYVFGAEYVLSRPVIGLLVTAIAVRTINKPAGFFFIATENSRFETYAIGIRTVIRFALLFAGALTHSLTLVAMGYLLEHVVSLGFSIWFQRKYVTFSWPDATSVSKFIVANGAMVAVVLSISSRISGFITTLTLVFLGGIVYFASLYATGFLTRSDKKMVTVFALPTERF
ncbi:MAG: oligosaccharide flippase family protein, partial [Halobacteriaceae archaeon]